MALLGAVDGGASDPEQVGQFGGAVLTGLEQADQMCFREKVKWRTGSEGRINHIKRSYGWNRTELAGLNGARR